MAVPALTPMRVIDDPRYERALRLLRLVLLNAIALATLILTLHGGS